MQRITNSFFTAMCIFLVPFSFAMVNYTQTHTLYDDVMRNHLNVFPWEEEEWPNNEPFNKYLKRALQYQLHPHIHKKRAQAFKFVSSYYKQCGTHPAMALPRSTWIDLNFFCGQSNVEEFLASKIDRTQTDLGRAYLYGMLVQPTTDREVLHNKQHVVQSLLRDEKRYELIHEQLSVMASHEPAMIALWNNDLLNNAAKRHYFSLPWIDKLNNSEWGLMISSIVGHQEQLSQVAALFAATIVLPLYAFYLMKSNDPIAVVPFEGTAIRFQATANPLYAFIAQFSNKTIEAGISAGTAVFCGLKAHEQIAWTRDNFLIDRCLHEKLIHCAAYMNACEQIYDLICQDKQLLVLFPELDKVTSLFENASPSMKKLLSLLSTETFCEPVGTLSNYGRILLVNHLMHTIKDEFMDALIALAQLDAYMSIACLYQEGSWCFAKYSSNQQPSIVLDEFWNPFITPAKVVKNSIALGGVRANSAIITGPNEGGKSTILKAVALNVILAQTLTIAPAEQLYLTPFAHINTYLNITDDLASGNSLFKSEVLRMDHLLTTIKTCRSNEFCFSAIDEMFTGTSPEEGKAAAFSVAAHLGTQPKSICVLTTHFSELTQLGIDQCGYSNYKVSVNIDEKGCITRTFTLEPGISDQHIALDILKREGIEGQIIDTAYAFMHEHANKC